MSGASWWPVVGVIISALVAYLTARLGARAENKRKTAEAGLFEAQAQEIITKGWNADLARRDVKITKQENQILDFERRLESIDSELQDAHEQNRLQAEHLAVEQRKNRLLTQHLEAAQARLRAALVEVEALKEQLVVAKQQVIILTEHAQRVDEWLVRHFAKNGHTEDPDKPPRLIGIDEKGAP